MLGFSKIFVIVLFIAVIVGYGSENWVNGLMIVLVYAIIAIIWKLLT
jgi:Ca2+/H+ antiporter